MAEFDFNQLARANADAALCQASIRQQPTHFRVDEQLPFEPAGEGGHTFLLIEKTGSNSDWLAGQLARFAGVGNVDVGYAGLKDRHAVTTQWFSIKLEGHDEPDWDQFSADNCRILERCKHTKKLKRGVLAGNQFSLLLTDIEGDKARWEQNLERIKSFGVPNYFAQQRFGHNLNNLQRAQQWFEQALKPKKAQQRKMILSAGRSWLFNLVLSERIKQNNWQQWLSGDVMQLDGSASVFLPDSNDDTVNQRLENFDIHPTGPLWGRGRPLSQQQTQVLEQQVLADWQSWQQGLEQAGLKQARRALRLVPQQLSWQWHNNELLLRFFLPPGSYATAVLRELADITDVSLRNSAKPDFSQL